MHDILNAYWDFLNKFSPFLLAGFLLAGILHAFVNDKFIQKNLVGSKFINIILGNIPPGSEIDAGDMNNDDIINVLDIILIVNIILNP